MKNFTHNYTLHLRGFEKDGQARSLVRVFLAQLIFLMMFVTSASAQQLGEYNFTGTASCPTQNPSVTTQPYDAVFSAYSIQGVNCNPFNDVQRTSGWSTSTTINTGRYNQFTITPNAGNRLNLTSFTFTESVNNVPAGGTSWQLRSSLNNYASAIGTGTATTSSQTITVALPAATFTNIGAVTFRLYLIAANSSSTLWVNDAVSLSGTVTPTTPANPTSNSPQCATQGVTITRSGTVPANQTWYWQTTASGTNTTASASTYIVNTSGTYYLRAQSNTSLLWSTSSGIINIVSTPSVGLPAFTLGATSVRCQGSGNVTYTATASDATSIVYALDAASIEAGNTINATTGVVTYVGGFSGTSTVTATASGCGISTTTDHVVTTTSYVTVPVFTMGSSSIRCQGVENVQYDAAANYTTGITYALDNASKAAGNTIDVNTGVVSYVFGWSGTSIITATAAGCTPKSATHTVTITPTVGLPVFAMGATSNRCQSVGTDTYNATSTNSTGITYSLDATSIAAGNSIDATTGAVTYMADWFGTSVITALATGCNGPISSTHTVTINPPVTVPVFTLGDNSARCQGGNMFAYAATANYTTGITYTLDAASISAGNSINATTGEVMFQSNWFGTSTITASAAGCAGPQTYSHVVITTATVGLPVFDMGATSIRCRGEGIVTYAATATTTTGITYSLNAASLSAGNTINELTGEVTYVETYSGTAIITASAAGCNGPRTSVHTVTVTPYVGATAFTLGATSVRCQGSGNVTYTATASDATSIVYALDAASIEAGNTINATTGVVTYVGGFSGTSTVTATASGCGISTTTDHVVTTTSYVTVPVFTMGSSSIRCQGVENVQYDAAANYTTGITYALDNASKAAGNTIDVNTGVVSYVFGWSGTSVITATAAGCTPKSATHTVTITPTVGLPVFAMGATSNRCQSVGTDTYNATSTNSTGITYNLDATSIAAGNSIDATTGAVTYMADWFGTSVITALATGCNGPISSTHTVTINPPVTVPVFTLGDNSARCQGGNMFTYAATANYTTGITYTLDAASISAGNSINATTGEVTFQSNWFGTSTITASAAGCAGPQTYSHVVITTATVGLPVFDMGATSIRCRGEGIVTYAATATTTTGITYSLNAASLSAGNTINELTGEVTYVETYSGTAIITASAAGCNGPRTSVHTVTVTPYVGATAFTLGATSVRCQGSGNVTYTATASDATSIVYALDAASIEAGNTINATTGVVTYVGGFSGTSTVTATASGCGISTTTDHVVTTTSYVTVPVFTMGSSSIRCQGVENVQYDAAANYTTGITYALDNASKTAGNTIDVNTGVVSYVFGWSGTSVITATAAGCTPKSATHTVTITPTVGLPVFAMGATSNRCQAPGTVYYIATATTNTGITYSLDASSLAAGNTIASTTGEVTYVGAWFGTTTITATATGCNGPRSTNHTVTIIGVVTKPIFAAGDTATRCQASDKIIYNATANNLLGSITYSLDAASKSAGNKIKSNSGEVDFEWDWTGISTVTASAPGCFGPQTSTITIVTIRPVTTPVFVEGSTSTRCQGDGSFTYKANSNYNTSDLTYRLNTSSLIAGNTINTNTGEVTFVSSWSGTSTVTATAVGCYGPVTATHTITITPTVGTPVFSLGATSTRCQGGGTVTYSASASNTTSRRYSLDEQSVAAGNYINIYTGAVTFSSGFNGTSVITVVAQGCNGPSTAIHTITTTPSVETPVFAMGSSSTRCRGAGSVAYNASANFSTGITYTLDFWSRYYGNTINATTGVVTYTSTWYGTSVITASAAGCNGPEATTHTVTTFSPVTTPVFTSGSSSTRCIGAAVVTYTANANNSQGITYSLDATSLAAGNTINSLTGVVTYASTWSGSTQVIATAAGCGGPISVTHIVTINPVAPTPVFNAGTSSTRCNGAGTIIYTATPSSGITYSLDAATIAGGNTINSTTGAVNYVAGWVGTTIITARSGGCGNPIATHSATSTPTVLAPVFTLGSASTRCQSSASVSYDASASNSTSITFTLDSLSISGGNTINAATGLVSFTSSWIGMSTITATAVGCNGPAVSTHKITTNSNGTPVFTLGATSTRLQAAGNVPYAATTSNATGVSYVLDDVSIAAGNSINIATGVVSYVATWQGVSTITASSNGCLGAVSTIHIVTSTPSSVLKQLYLSDPSQSLDRIDPVNTADKTTATTANVAVNASISFTQTPALCAPLIIKTGGTLSVENYINPANGSMPANPAITAVLKYDNVILFTLTNPTYNSTTKLLKWTSVITSDVVVPANKQIVLTVTNQSSVAFSISYDSDTKPSKIDLPVSTYIEMPSFKVYNAPYPNGVAITGGIAGTKHYVRAVVTDPFGAADITALNLTITPDGTTVPVPVVATSGCSKTYEYVWNSSITSGYVELSATAKEGYENTVSATKSLVFSNCSDCPPLALNDSATGAGGSPLMIDVLANDSDPNNNMNPSSLKVLTQPANGNAVITNGQIVYLPNGIFTGTDYFTYQICDLTSPTALCSVATVKVEIDPTIIDPCSETSKSHVYYVPFPEKDTRVALIASTASFYLPMPSSNIRTIISLKFPYPGMTVSWDHWEDSYESNILNPMQSSTKVWGDGDIYNGIAPGYPNDLIPAGGSIILDNTLPSNPRVQANIFYDGRDKIYASGEITLTQVSGEPSIIGLQCMKTNVSSTNEFGLSFTIPVGQNFNSQDFRYTALFIRAAENATVVSIDKDNNGTFETTATLNEGESMLVNGGVLTGATVTATKPIGVDLHFGGVDGYSSREVPIYPATWYSSEYYTPVATTKSTSPSVVMLYNNLNRPITINWSSGAPASGNINLAPKQVVRFPLALSSTNAYSFINPTGESFTAIEIVDSYTPGGGGSNGPEFDWSFNLIAQERLTTFATIAWAPGSTNGTRNDNPIWVTPIKNTTIYVKYDGNVTSGGNLAPNGLHYDVSYSLNKLKYLRILDNSDKDQSGIAIFTADGTKIAAVYGEDPSTANTGNPSWDVGSTIKPFCASKLIFANDDFAYSLTDRAVTIPVLLNDEGFTSEIDPSTVNVGGFLRTPKNGKVSVNEDGTLLYTPNPGFTGTDSLQYQVCSTPSPVCDVALVVIKVAGCPTPVNRTMINGQVYADINKDAKNNDGKSGFGNTKVYLYADGNCNGIIDANELQDSVTVDTSGYYQFITYPEKTVSDNFDNPDSTSSCANGTDGTMQWLTNWVDAGDPSSGFCVTPPQSNSNTRAEILLDKGNYALRLKNRNISAMRRANLSGGTAALLSFTYRRASALATGEDVLVQASSNGSTYTTLYTIKGNGKADTGYVNVYNQDVTPFASSGTYIRFLTNGSLDDDDEVFIDDVSITFLKYPNCYITKVDTASIPFDHYVTTGTQTAQTVAVGGTCTFPVDFGVAKGVITVAGTVFNDINGLTDNQVNGTATGAPSGNTLYAYIKNAAGNVHAKATVNALNGTYFFSNVEVGTGFTVLLSTNDVATNAVAPTSVNLPAGWVSVGESYGINNKAGTGNESGVPNSAIAINTGLFNITGINFGIEQRPVAGEGTNMYANPGGTLTVDVNKSTFMNVLLSSDASSGKVKSMRISTFPPQLTSIFIDNVKYDSSNFPVGGVTISANDKGEPGKSIKIDPKDGYIKVTIPFYVIDDAGVESSNEGKALIKLPLDTDKDGIVDVIDIDDDNDGITDIIETCGKGATSFSCFFGKDPAEDGDDDGLINCYDPDFGPVNQAGCIVTLDTDGDGIPDFLDLDSDNDGITDAVEAYGFDEKGDGILDKYTDTDYDGLNQLVDLNTTGAAGSGTGLGFQDFDKDGIPNSRDLDSDGDGIPDIVEVQGADADNNGMVDGFVDNNRNGLHDVYEDEKYSLLLTGEYETDDKKEDYPFKNVDQLGYPNPYDLDSDGDGIVDMVEAGFSGSNGRASGFLGADGWSDIISSKTSLTLPNSDGRGLPNVYDVDSDDDGISDNIEAQPTFSYKLPADITPAVLNTLPVICSRDLLPSLLQTCTRCNGTGLISGGGDDDDDDDNGTTTCTKCFGTLKSHTLCGHGWDGTSIAEAVNGGLTGGFSKGSTNVYTASDTDQDGIVNDFEPFQSTVFGGNGLTPYDLDSDGLPDYIDTDTDNDGILDIKEASKILTLSQTNIKLEDNDSDGLVDQFDISDVRAVGKKSKGLNIGNNKMGTLGIFSGPGESGSNTTLIRSSASPIDDRDWRMSTALPLQIISFTGNLAFGNLAQLKWIAENEQQVDYYQVERSFNSVQWQKLGTVKSTNGDRGIYTYQDDLTHVDDLTYYYRIRQYSKNGNQYLTTIIILKREANQTGSLKIFPNPFRSSFTINVQSSAKQKAQIDLIDENGKVILRQQQMVNIGNNAIHITSAAKLPIAIYLVRVEIGDKVWIEQLLKQ